jgi:dipeptidyl aminopeptidase/acylaminoacyl peptidase
MSHPCLLAAAAALLIAAAPEQGQEQAPLLPRSALFSNPDHALPRISPDGTYLSWLAPVDGALNVWVGQVDKPEKAQPVTREKGGGIRSYDWAYTSEHILYLRDHSGRGHWQLVCVDLITGQERAITPQSATALGADAPHPVSARLERTSPRHAEEILVGINDRDPAYHDLYRANIATGALVGVEVNDGLDEYYADDEYTVRFAARATPQGGRELLIRSLTDEGERGWEHFADIPAEDAWTTGIVAFDLEVGRVEMLDSRGRDTAILKSVELATRSSRIVAKDRNADIGGGILVDPTGHTVQAAAATYQRKKWYVIDESLKPDFKYLERLVDGELEILSRTLDDRQWVVGYDLDRGAARYYLYDRDSGDARQLFVDRSRLDGAPLAPMYSELIKTRDKWKMVSYYTLPPGSDRRGNGKPLEPLPTVLCVHGGPWWSRERWGFDPVHQWLANRGYAVLSVNYRGSVGFGKKFLDAANGEWGGRMHDDLLDAVQWAVERKIADPKRIAIMGGSYGGYAALAALTQTPETFACGVDLAGPADLVSFLESVPASDAAARLWAARIGDHRTEEGRAALAERSPLSHADRISRPLLIAQGANDPRVRKGHADRVARTLKDNGVPVTYLVYDDEGHGLARLENRLSFFAVAEQFLAGHLGGRYEPVGDDFRGAAVRIIEGADQLAGVNSVR